MAFKHRIHHWSNSKLAEKIRGKQKPNAATWDDWEEWKSNTKESSPIRFWIAEELLGKLQDIWYWPLDVSYSVKYYVVNRWVDQSHALVAHPNHIKPGKWMDLSERTLYCLFDELVDFVEIEKAYSNYRWQEKKPKTLKWWQGGRWRTRTWRSAEAGIEHLKWEMSLTNEEWLDEDQTHLVEPTQQARTAKEIYELYIWWTEVYTNRPCPYETSGWSDYCASKRERGIGLLSTDPDEDPKHKNRMMDEINQIQEEYEREEEEMLIRLIKIRKGLWT